MFVSRFYEILVTENAGTLFTITKNRKQPPKWVRSWCNPLTTLLNESRTLIGHSFI